MIGFIALFDPSHTLPTPAVDNLLNYIAERDLRLETAYRDGHVALLASADLSLCIDQTGPFALRLIGNVTSYGHMDVGAESRAEDKANGLRQVAKLYVAGGPSAAFDLSGDHHFILWDEARGRLVCGHDRLGCRPIFYLNHGSMLVAASSLRLLRALELAKPQIEQSSVRRFVIGQSLTAGRTFYQGISRLTPGAGLIYSAEGLEVTPGKMITRPEVAMRVDAPADFRAVFTASVESRLPARDDVVVMLSGGLDSSAITTIAALKFSAAHELPVKTISMVFDGNPQWSERSFIEDVTRTLKTASTIIDVDDYAPFEDFDTALDEQGGLFLAPGLIMSRRMYAHAAGLGAQVVLDGHGGDEVVSHGSGRLHDLAEAQCWRLLAREAKGSAAITGEPALLLFLLYFLRYGPLKPLSLGFVRLKRRLARVLTPVARANARESLLAHPHQTALHQDSVHEADTDVSLRWNNETRMHYRTLTDPGQAAALEILNAAAAAASIEPRYPFWDEGMIDLCLSLEAAEKLNRGWPRLVMREAIPELPQSVRWRRDKLDFSPHLARGLVRHHSDLMTEVFSKRSDRVSNFVDMNVAKKAYQEVLTRSEGASGEALQIVWRVLALALWLDGLESGALAGLVMSGARR